MEDINEPPRSIISRILNALREYMFGAPRPRPVEHPVVPYQEVESIASGSGTTSSRPTEGPLPQTTFIRLYRQYALVRGAIYCNVATDPREVQSTASQTPRNTRDAGVNTLLSMRDREHLDNTIFAPRRTPSQSIYDIDFEWAAEMQTASHEDVLLEEQMEEALSRGTVRRSRKRPWNGPTDGPPRKRTRRF